MSHHFDSKLGRENPALSICDLYIFPGSPGNTVMAMTVNADVGLSAPDVLPDEGLYVFRIDTNGDAHEEVAFKFRFDAARHADGDGHRHVQRYRVLRAEGDEIPGDGGTLLLEGETNQVAEAKGVRAFAGVAPEMWAADALAFFEFLEALYEKDRFGGEAFEHRVNYFKNRNVMALVLEVPDAMLGSGHIHAWATTSLFGHAPEVQVYRWGFPLFTHLFLSDPRRPDLVEMFHETAPDKDVELFAPAVTRFVSRLASTAGSTSEPDAYGEGVAYRLCPAMLPYRVGAPATFEVACFNGRPLARDAFDVMLTIGANRPIADGVAPPGDRVSGDFPYFGEAYTPAEQAGLAPISTGFKA